MENKSVVQCNLYVIKRSQVTFDYTNWWIFIDTMMIMGAIESTGKDEGFSKKIENGCFFGTGHNSYHNQPMLGVISTWKRNVMSMLLTNLVLIDLVFYQKGERSYWKTDLISTLRYSGIGLNWGFLFILRVKRKKIEFNKIGIC